jgi:hypothetical protein
MTMTRTATFFDTLLFSQAMRDSGMSEKTANALAEEMKKLRENNDSATKGDIELLKRDMQIMEQRLTIKLGGFLTIAVGVIVALLKF